MNSYIQDISLLGFEEDIYAYTIIKMITSFDDKIEYKLKSRIELISNYRKRK